MTEEPTVESAESESPPHGPGSNPAPAADSAISAWAARVTASQPAATRPTRSRRKKILVPAVLGVIGTAVIVVGLWMYPQRPDVSTAAATLLVDGSSPYVDSHMGLYIYQVSQARPGVAVVSVLVELLGPPYTPGYVTRVPRGARANIQLFAGAPMRGCSPGCALDSTDAVA
jgi:hypothetical protein